MEWFLPAPVPGPIDFGIAPTGALLAVIVLLVVAPLLCLVLRNAFTPRPRAPRVRQLCIVDVPPVPKRRAA